MTTALAQPFPSAPPPHELRRLLGRYVPAAVAEMEHEVAARLPAYADAFNRTRDFSVRRVVDRTVHLFLAALGAPGPGSAAPLSDLTAFYERIGAQHCRAGYPVDTLGTALGVAGQVARRRLIRAAYQFHWPESTLECLIETTFVLIRTATESALGGFAQEDGPRSLLDGRRARLRDALVADLTVDGDSLAALAEAAAWPLPDAVTVVALPPGTAAPAAALPDEVLVQDAPEAPYLIVPGERVGFPLLRTRGAALGPLVPVGRAADSLRWALHAVDLVRRGVLPVGRPLRCADHLATLTASRAGDLLDAAAVRTLGPLLELPERRRGPLLRTLFAYLDSGDNAVVTARRLYVHEQTVRYRLRQIAEVTRDAQPSAQGRLETMLVLARLLGGGGAVARP
ncbi:helix-turn-helix domain-containing protein [Streptomyces sp. NPDC057694]|uniref:helix-turn-helix domain-containing protein n=1 Tax=Streptomyces sp. NPDC057694 TaxID=3346216 RepID=UPI00367E6082